MPVTKSAQKRLRKEGKRRERNDNYKNKMKSLLKEVKGLVSEKKIKEAKDLLPQAYKILDKSAKTGVIKKNAASRNKSKLANLINRSSNAGDQKI